MSLKTTTKDRLIAFITEDLGHYIHDSEASGYKECWAIECKRCNNYDESYRVDSLLQSMRNEEDIICTKCKDQVKRNKFAIKQGFTLDKITYQDKSYDLLRCNHCALSYGYVGKFFDKYRCYCKLRIKQDEKQVYTFLQTKFPEALFLREQVVHFNHKADIVMKLEGKTFYLEIDDAGHFGASSQRCVVDIQATKQFTNNFDEDCYLIRIPTRIVKDFNYTKYLTEIIQQVVDEDDEDIPAVILFRTKNRDYYLHIDIPQDEHLKVTCEMLKE